MSTEKIHIVSYKTILSAIQYYHVYKGQKGQGIHRKAIYVLLLRNQFIWYKKSIVC